MTVISGAERRRRWSDEDRARILAVVSEPGAVIAEVARREDVCTSLVFKWRRDMRETTEAAAGGFAPVVIEPTPAAPCLSPSSNCSNAAVIEVELKDARVRIHAGVRIPIQSGQVFRREAGRGFRFDVGHRSDLKPATIPM
ncbi:transposase [Rhodoblastus acidophilus]|uniref:IS66-like element accessory protein TnpA n=1 Tax=Rhodoblastus acidophilus TaxID=1074 RepID=UPI0022243736|nr:transposase [Rhodoblastus acidophilus]MCW2319216.1 transposase [Rhodoblastus acidophilus]